MPAALFCELENDVDWEGPLKIMWSLPESKYQPDELQKEKHTGYHTVSVLFCDSLQTQGDDKLKKTPTNRYWDKCLKYAFSVTTCIISNLFYPHSV